MPASETSGGGAAGRALFPSLLFFCCCFFSPSPSPPSPRLLVTLALIAIVGQRRALATWTNAKYPDLRGPSIELCAPWGLPLSGPLYVCDPDRVLNATQVKWLNERLQGLAVGTPCHCQRRSQCSSAHGRGGLHGFVVSVAIVDNLQMTIHSPSEEQLNERADSFCRTLEGKWALGDCGNSAIIFVWRHYKKMIIWPARLAERYVSESERSTILSEVNDLMQNDQWAAALVRVVERMHEELQGEPEPRLDTGTLSLILAIGVAFSLTVLIYCCVCAFRCCGNLRPEAGGVRKAVRRVDSLRQEVVRRGSQLRRSFSRSPKLSPRVVEASSTNFFPDSDTTMV